jgi:hypothetical protein
MLGLRQLAGDKLDGVDGINADRILVVGMEVRSAVLPTCLDEHADDDAVEARNLWHDDEDTNVVPGVA